LFFFLLDLVLHFFFCFFPYVQVFALPLMTWLLLFLPCLLALPLASPPTYHSPRASLDYTAWPFRCIDSSHLIVYSDLEFTIHIFPCLLYRSWYTQERTLPKPMSLILIRPIDSPIPHFHSHPHLPTLYRFALPN
jgi:hypothetical protein